MQTIKDSLIAYWSLLDDNTSRQHRLTLVAIIVAGFLLRLYSLAVGQAYTYFAINDEVTALKYALGLLAGDPHMLYLGSPALNEGNIPGPLWSLLVAMLYKLGGNSAEGAIFGMIVLNTVVIYLVYKLGKAFMPNRYALLSSVLYALSPWVIYYAGGLYNPIPLALLGALLFLSLWQTTQVNNSKSIFWVCLLAAAIPQFHMIGIFYLPVILLLLYFSPQKLNYRWFGTGIVAGLLLYLPYLIGDILNNWQNTRAILHGDKAFSLGILKIISIPIAMLANHPGQWAGAAFDDFKVFADQYFGSYVVLIIINLLSIVLSATFIFSLIRKFFRYLRQHRYQLKTCYQQHAAVMFITLVIFLPLLLYTLTGRAYTTRYSIMIFPLLYLLPALFLLTLTKPGLKRNMLYALGFISLVNVYMVVTFYHDQHQRMQTSNVLMPSFQRLMEIKNRVGVVTKNDEHVEITYSETVSKLPEVQRKLYTTITDLLEAYSYTRAAAVDSTKVRKLKVLQGTETISDYHLDHVIYRSPALNIIDLTLTER